MHRTHSDLNSWFWVSLLFAVLAFAPAPAEAAEDLRPSDMQSGSLLLRMATGYETAALLNTEVDMQISGLVARVSVRQSFRNTSDEWVEGVYVFPLPDKAAVDRMRLHIGERFIEGEIQEKAQARETYEKAKSEGRKTSLVEQQRANLFTTSLANIAPGEEVVVEVEYLEDIRFEEGQFSLRFPMTLTPRYISGTAMAGRQGNGWSPDTDEVADASLITPPQVTSSKGHRITLNARIDAGMPLEIIASRYHPIKVDEERGRYKVRLGLENVAMDHDFELVWRPVPSATPRAMVFREDIGGKPHVLLMMMPPDQAEVPAAAMPRETIFIVDTSGSMHGVSISQAKRAVRLAIQGLKPGDLFNVIEFNSVTRPLFPASQVANTANIDIALRFVDGLQANGGTEMRPALSMALDSPPSGEHLRQVVFITDGSIGYEDLLFTMIEEKLGNARLFTVGIGSAPNSWFMRKAAEAGKGSYTFISALHEVQEKMDSLFQKLEQPQVTDIDVAWPSGVVVDSYPAQVPDLYIGEPVTVKAAITGKLRRRDVVQVSGNSMTGSWSAELPLRSADDNPGIGALWARARIGRLMDVERRQPDPSETRKAIVATALEHHLVSKYTSLVAVDKTPVRPADEALHSDQVPNLLPYGQSMGAILGFAQTSTNAPLMRLTGLLTLAFGLCMLIAWRRWPERHRVRQ
ncbi:MAG: marine proteobacterial sortase target protein [Pseudomonadota bacterium]